MKTRRLQALAPSFAFAALLLPLACGGGTPAPKDSDEAVASSAKAAPASAPADSAGNASSGGATSGGASSPAGDSSPAPAATASAAPSSDDALTKGDDPWMAPHQMPQKDVLKTMRPAQGKVQACFRAGLKRDPSASGEVKIKFVITNDGAVRVWKDDESAMSDADVIQCVGELIKTLKFPKQKSPGDAWATFSANFSN